MGVGLINVLQSEWVADQANSNLDLRGAAAVSAPSISPPSARLTKGFNTRIGAWALLNQPWFRSSLERDPQRQLNASARTRSSDLAKLRIHLASLSVEPGRRVHCGELCMVEGVVELRAQLRVDPFLDPEILERRKIEVVDAGPADHGPRRVAKRADSRHGENIGFEPMVEVALAVRDLGTPFDVDAGSLARGPGNVHSIYRAEAYSQRGARGRSVNAW